MELGKEAIEVTNGYSGIAQYFNAALFREMTDDATWYVEYSYGQPMTIRLAELWSLSVCGDY